MLDKDSIVTHPSSVPSVEFEIFRSTRDGSNLVVAWPNFLFASRFPLQIALKTLLEALNWKSSPLTFLPHPS